MLQDNAINFPDFSVLNINAASGYIYSTCACTIYIRHEQYNLLSQFDTKISHFLYGKLTISTLCVLTYWMFYFLSNRYFYNSHPILAFLFSNLQFEMLFHQINPKNPKNKVNKYF